MPTLLFGSLEHAATPTTSATRAKTATSVNTPRARSKRVDIIQRIACDRRVKPLQRRELRRERTTLPSATAKAPKPMPSHAVEGLELGTRGDVEQAVVPPPGV